MKTLIIDTSVFIKWLNQDNEQDLNNADKILQDVKNGQVELMAPELVKYEIGNVLLKGKHLTPDQAYIPLGTAYSLPITFIAESERQAIQTYDLAHTLGVSYYDASFMSLAKQYNATLVTDNFKHQGRTSDVKVIELKNY